MHGWQKFYNKNFAKGIILSILIHLVLVLFLMIPVCDLEPIDYLYFEDQPHQARVILHQIEISNLLADKTIGGRLPGSGEQLEIKAGINAVSKLGIPIASNIPDSFEIGMNNKRNDSITSRNGLRNSEGNGTGDGSGVGFGDGLGSGRSGGKVYSSLPFIPRQILEVLPEKSECSKGMIILALHVGKNGNVKTHKVMMNSSGRQICLEKVIEAAYKSRWQSVKIEGDVVEYWVEKTYTFN